MSEIRPFRAYRPRPDLALKMAAFPYDVIDSNEARVIAEGNPYSFLHIGKPEIDLEPSISLYDDKVYAKGVENLNNFISKGWLIRDETPHFYIYQQNMGRHIQAGLVCLCSVREYEENKIKRHEFTRKDKEDDRTRHVTECNANAEPVFLAYRAKPDIDEILDAVITNNPPVCDIVTDDDIGHKLWIVPKDLEKQICQKFLDVPCLYVADGHHRTAAAVRHGQMARQKDENPSMDRPYEWFMAVVFPHNQLKILDYNRVVKDLAGYSETEFFDAVRENFIIEQTEDPRPHKPKEFCMYIGNRWYRLNAKPNTYPQDDPVLSLDVSILQNNILGPILKIHDPRTDKRIDFIGGIRGLKELEKRCREGWAVAFALYPTSLEELFRVADAGLVMPPKSTWFEPKLRSGLFVRLLDE